MNTLMTAYPLPQESTTIPMTYFKDTINAPFFEHGPGAFGIEIVDVEGRRQENCLLYTSPSPRDRQKSRMPSSA